MTVHTVWWASRSWLSEGLPKGWCTSQALASLLEASLMLRTRVSAPSVPPSRSTSCSLLLLGSTRPAHSPPEWSPSRSSSSAAFHIARHLIGPARSSWGTSSFTAPSLFHLSCSGRHRAMDASLFCGGPKSYEPLPTSCPVSWLPGAGGWMGTLGLAQLPWHCQMLDASMD